MDRMILATTIFNLNYQVDCVEGKKYPMVIYGKDVDFFVHHEGDKPVLSHYRSGHYIGKVKGKTFGEYLRDAKTELEAVEQFVEGLIHDHGVERVLQRFMQARVLNA